MNVGDRVWWESQSAGSRRIKVGEVVEVVPAGARPRPTGSMHSPGRSRDHESYVVRARYADDPGSRTRLYWPRASQLRKVTKP